jgi:glyoxylase-like metal-dependent hydrolase (beta-lactamase superfamily II)
MEEGHTNSDIANFQYVVDRRDRTAYVSEEVLPGVRMIRDSDNDKMFLLQGTRRDVLIDSGMGRGDLRAYVSQYTGGRPLEVIFTHNHGDHIGQADQFIRTSTETIGAPDKAGLVRFLLSRGIPQAVIDQHVMTSTNGERKNIGGRSLELYNAPGHTPGSIVIYDRTNGYLFSGDAFGSNSPTIPDALFMQFTSTPLDDYWSMIKHVRAELGPNVRYMMTGHNDRPLAGPAYLDNLEAALQRLMDQGDAALIPSYRPVGLLQVMVGNRFTDPNWVAINVNHAAYLPAPVDRIDGLDWLSIVGAKLEPAFSPEVKQYTAALQSSAPALTVTVDPTSSRSTFTFNGVAAKAGTQTLKLTGSELTVAVRSPDGTQTATYTVTVKRHE